MTANPLYAPPLTLRNLPLDLYEWLKQDAANSHRSLNKHFAAIGSAWREWRTNGVTPVAAAEPKAKTAWEMTPEERYAAVMAVVNRVSAMPILDHRTPDEILGYDEHGLPS